MQALSVRPADNACRDAAADRYRDRRTGVETVDEEGIARVCPFDPIVRNSRACLLLVNYPRCACLRTTSTSLPTKYAGSPLSHTYVRCRARRRVLTRCIVRIYIRRDMLVFKATNLIQSLSSLPRCLRDRGSWSLPLNRHRGGISIQRPTTNAQSCEGIVCFGGFQKSRTIETWHCHVPIICLRWILRGDWIL